ncbi:MAG: c-type cytochrome [Longimicrobiales bacterium]
MKDWVATVVIAAVLSLVGMPALAQTRAAAAADTTGKAIFLGKGNCHVCHGKDAKGTPLAPDLTDAELLNIDGKLESISKLVKAGVPAPKKHPAPMPPMGGMTLSDAEVQAVAAYVFSLRAPPK